VTLPFAALALSGPSLSGKTTLYNQLTTLASAVHDFGHAQRVHLFEFDAEFTPRWARATAGADRHRVWSPDHPLHPTYIRVEKEVAKVAEERVSDAVTSRGVFISLDHGQIYSSSALAKAVFPTRSAALQFKALLGTDFSDQVVARTIADAEQLERRRRARATWLGSRGLHDRTDMRWIPTIDYALASRMAVLFLEQVVSTSKLGRLTELCALMQKEGHRS